MAAASSSAESAAARSSAVDLAGELGARHAALLNDLAALSVEVASHRCAAAGRLPALLCAVLTASAGMHSCACRQDAASLHSQVAVLKGQLAAEASSISGLRDYVAAATQQEAATLVRLQGQVGEPLSRAAALRCAA
jgi:hypothetical protein